MPQELLRLILAQVFLHAAMTGLRMSGPLLVLYLGLGEIWVGVLVALFSVTQVFLSLPAGRVVDRMGLRTPMHISFVLASLGCLAAFIWPILPVLGLAALLCGAATGLTIIALQRHVGQMATNPEQLRNYFSWLSLGPAFSNFLGPVFAGALIDGFGHRWAFLGLAFLPLISAWLIHPVASRPVVTAQSHSRPRSWDLLRHAPLRRLLLINWLLATCWDVHTFMVPVLGHERGLSASAIGAILGGFALTAAVIRLILPWVGRAWREWQLIAVAMLSSCVLLFIYPFMSQALSMGLLSAGLGIFLGMVQPMVVSMLHHISPEHRRGEALGLRLMAINASSAVMPMLMGVLGGALGVFGVFWSVSALVGLGARQCWHFKRLPQPE